jgi:LmbE family N-acetylglucosaminyl deacetylase
MASSILVICAHPDDETLGCGGTLLRHAENGDRISWVIATRAIGDRWSDEVRLQKDEEIRRVAEAYSIDERFELKLPSASLDRVPLGQLMEGIADAVKKVRPSTVYVVHSADVHTDHHAVFNATMSVLKPFHMRQLGVERILSFETLSSTDAAPFRIGGQFVPNLFIDAGSKIERKIEIMRLYASESQPDPMPRGPSAIRALARYRGATIGVEYAEAFMLIRECQYANTA